MEITRDHRGDVAIISIHGKFVGGIENSEMFHEFVRETINAGTKRIVVSLRDAPWANSQGIGMLIGALTSAKSAGARLVLAEVGGRIRDVLAVTRLTIIFEIFDSVDRAVESLSGKTRSHREQPASRAM